MRLCRPATGGVKTRLESRIRKRAIGLLMRLACRQKENPGGRRSRMGHGLTGAEHSSTGAGGVDGSYKGVRQVF